MEKTTSLLTSQEITPRDRSNINDEKEIYEALDKEEKRKLTTDVEMEDELRERKTSGFFIHEFITRNGWNVEKLPTFHHLHISELSHGVIDFQDKMHSEFVRQWRRVVTGDPNKYVLHSFKNPCYLLIYYLKIQKFSILISYNKNYIF